MLFPKALKTAPIRFSANSHSRLLPRQERYCTTGAISAGRARSMKNVKAVIYHNPKCSKSRETLQILLDHNIEMEIIDYQDDPPTPQELARIIGLLGVSARELMRSTEQVYKDADLDDDSLSDDDIIEAICEYPALLQRPIVISGNKAVIGRPPTRVLEIIA
jgi:arsenate reductase